MQRTSERSADRPCGPFRRFPHLDDEGWFGAKFPQGVDELHFVVHGIIKDIDRLKELFELFSETLYQLVEMGVALPASPGVKL